MALELNNKKYLVLCVMLILLNHHINGAKGAGPGPVAQAPVAGPGPVAQAPVAGPGPVAQAPVAGPGPVAQVPVAGPGPVAQAPVAGPGPVAQAPVAGPGPVAQVPVAGPGPVAQAPVAGPGPVAQAPVAGPSSLQLHVPKFATKGAAARNPDFGNQPLKSDKPNNNVNGIGSPNTAGQPLVPCYFIFGDSLVDHGNNNKLATLARADYDPYGIDFKPAGATGRFCNGKTTVDFTSDMLGFDNYIQPSEQTNGTAILQGLNFASAAAGIREETAQHLGDRITMRRQVENFKNKVGEMAGFLGGPKNTTDYLGKCLYQVGLGSNDYLNNYFVPNIYPTSKQLNPQQYADDLIKQYTTHLMAIYDLGARKFALIGVSQVGCTPNALSQSTSQDGTCMKAFNDANEMFNSRLKALVDTLNKDHPDAKFTYLNSFGMFQEIKDKGPALGFKNPTDGCCGIGKYKGQLTCLPGLTVCPNRDEYIFWDAYHPTEATNRIIARRAYIKESPTDVYPYDIHTLLTLK